jgi:glutamate-1-semialdehyde 2,1-aminomutase
LMAGLRDAATSTGHAALLQGPGPMFHFGFTGLDAVRDYRDTFGYDKAKYSAFVFAMQERGIRLIGRGLWYVSAAHTQEDVDHCITVTRQVLCDLPV